MGCLYCGAALPPRRRKFCSDLCQHRYYALRWRRQVINGRAEEHCENCGKILKYKQKRFCSEFCEKRYHWHQIRGSKLNIEGCARLRMAIVKQAKWDGCLETFVKRPCFYQLFPEITPEQVKLKGETR